jgi:hypothetical protein
MNPAAKNLCQGEHARSEGATARADDGQNNCEGV